jgi:uncharacterized CHY-type Zn-finger protein
MTGKMDWYCRNCLGEGEIDFPFKDEESAVVTCSFCQHKSAYYWCSNCGMGGQISVEDPTEYSTSWICNSCKKEYTFDEGLFTRQISFTPKAFGEPLKETKHISFKKGSGYRMCLFGIVIFTISLVCVLLNLIIVNTIKEGTDLYVCIGLPMIITIPGLFCGPTILGIGAVIAFIQSFSSQLSDQ